MHARAHTPQIKNRKATLQRLATHYGQVPRAAPDCRPGKAGQSPREEELGPDGCVIWYTRHMRPGGRGLPRRRHYQHHGPVVSVRQSALRHTELPSWKSKVITG